MNKVILLHCWWAKSLQSCPTLCNPMGYSPLGSSVHGILQARILEWVAMPFSRASCRPRGWPWVSNISCTAGGFSTTSATMNVKLWSHCGKLAGPQNIKYRITVWSSNSLLRYICKRIENRYSNYACPWMFRAWLLTIAERVKWHKCPLMGKWIKKMRCI